MPKHKRSVHPSLSLPILTCGAGVLLGSSLNAASSSAAAPVIASVPAGGWTVTAPGYTAKVSAGGSLESLQSGGFEWMAAPTNPVHGLFVAVGSTNLLPAGAREESTGIRADLPGFAVHYRFLPSAIEVIQANNGLAWGSSLALALTPQPTRAKDADTGAPLDIPQQKYLSGYVRLLAPNGAGLSVSGAALAWKESYWLLSFAGAPPEGETVYRLELNPTPRLEDRVVIKSVLPAADHTFWTDAPVTFTTEVSHAFGRPLDGQCALIFRSFLDSGPAREQVQPLKLASGATQKLSWVVGSLAPGTYIAEWEVRQGAERGVAARARFAFHASAILPPPPPDDFDAFWAETLKEQAAVPQDLQIKLHEDKGRSEIYKFSFAGLLGHRCHGWLTVPKDKTRRYPAVLFLPSSGLKSFYPGQFPDHDRVGMVISINTMDVDLPDESYDWSTWPAPYLCHGIMSKKRYWLRYSYAAMVRAAEILAQRPEVQPDDILVTGSSQGGGLTIIAAGLYPKFKAAVANVPALCRLDWNLLYLNPPYFPIAANADSRPLILRTLAYYDSVHFARRIQCPTWIAFGLMDGTTPPMGVYCAYNAIPGTNKTVKVFPWAGHNVSVSYADVVKGTWP